MATLAAIRKQIADLEKQADAIRKSDTASAVAKVKDLIALHGLTIDDLGMTKAAASKASGSSGAPIKGRKRNAAKTEIKTVGVAKYIDSKTGKTWTGRGKPPNWIAGVRNRDSFLIDGPTGTTGKSSDAGPAKKKTAAGKMGRKALAAAQMPSARQFAVKASKPDMSGKPSKGSRRNSTKGPARKSAADMAALRFQPANPPASENNQA